MPCFGLSQCFAERSSKRNVRPTERSRRDLPVFRVGLRMPGRGAAARGSNTKMYVASRSCPGIASRGDTEGGLAGRRSSLGS